MSLYDVLACPLCKGDIVPGGDHVRCTQCGREYPLVGGVPIMLPDPRTPYVQHESGLMLRTGYDPWIPRTILQSLADDQVVVDVGCGNMQLDDPCIIRMDITLSPYVDVVGDLHALPFKAHSLDFLFSIAVVEHLRQPFIAAEEMYAALKPGGYVFHDCNFVFPYHGFPHNYFNASIQGLQQVFSRFRELRTGVAPFHMPSFALDSVLQTYLALFPAVTSEERRFAQLVRLVLRFPLRHYDERFTPDAASRVAAGVYYTGVKEPMPGATTLPAAVMETHARTPELRARYPNPNDLSVPDNLMTWAKGPGRKQVPAIDAHFAGLKPFSKRVDTAHPWDRSWVRALPLPPHPDVVRTIREEPRRAPSTLEVLAALLLAASPPRMADALRRLLERGPSPRP